MHHFDLLMIRAMILVFGVMLQRCYLEILLYFLSMCQENVFDLARWKWEIQLKISWKKFDIAQ